MAEDTKLDFSGPRGKLTPTAESAGTVKTPVGSAPVLPILLLVLGGYLAWYGVHYWRNSDPHNKWPSDPIKDVLQGKGIPAPLPEQSAADVLRSTFNEAQPGGTGSGAAVGGAAIVSAAEKYIGTPYTWGGAPGTSPQHQGIGPHDCSSFVNWVVGHDLGLAIPGTKGGHGSYDGMSHGPDVASWIGWSGVQHVSGQPQPGDLVAWGPNQHIGIAVDNGNMVSALDTASGTIISPIGAGHITLRLRATTITASQVGGKGATKNRNIAKLLLPRFGWGMNQFNALDQLWNRESGWSTTAVNPNSGATGIPQLLPSAHKIPRNWASAVVQITWGLNYIKTTYGSPDAAWAHEQSHGWY